MNKFLPVTSLCFLLIIGFFLTSFLDDVATISIAPTVVEASGGGGDSGGGGGGGGSSSSGSSGDTYTVNMPDGTSHSNLSHDEAMDTVSSGGYDSYTSVDSGGNRTSGVAVGSGGGGSGGGFGGGGVSAGPRGGTHVVGGELVEVTTGRVGGDIPVGSYSYNGVTYDSYAIDSNSGITHSIARSSGGDDDNGSFGGGGGGSSTGFDYCAQSYANAAVCGCSGNGTAHFLGCLNNPGGGGLGGVPDLRPVNFDFRGNPTVTCNTAAELADGVCNDVYLTMQIQNIGDDDTDERNVPYRFYHNGSTVPESRYLTNPQVDDIDPSCWTRRETKNGVTFGQTNDIEDGDTSPCVLYPLVDLPVGTHTFYGIANDPERDSIDEVNFDNNQTPTITLEIEQPDPDLEVNGAFSPSVGCNNVSDFDASNECSSTTMLANIINVGGPFNNSFTTLFEYRDDASSPWVTAGTDTHGSGLVYNQDVNQSTSGVSIGIGRYDSRVCANRPVSVTESDSSNSSNCQTANFDIAPPPAEIVLTADTDLVRPDQTVELEWEVLAPYDMDCEVLGAVSDPAATFTHTGPSTNNTIQSDGLSSKQEFTLRCTPSTSDPTLVDFPTFLNEVFTETVTVDVVPGVQEI